MYRAGEVVQRRIDKLAESDGVIASYLTLRLQYLTLLTVGSGEVALYETRQADWTGYADCCSRDVRDACECADDRRVRDDDGSNLKWRQLDGHQHWRRGRQRVRRRGRIRHLGREFGG